MAHVAATRAKDRLFIMSHRINDKNIGTSPEHVFRAATRPVGSVKCLTHFPNSLALPSDPAVLVRTVHPISAVEATIVQHAMWHEDKEAYHSTYGPAIEGVCLPGFHVCLTHVQPCCNRDYSAGCTRSSTC